MCKIRSLGFYVPVFVVQRHARIDQHGQLRKELLVHHEDLEGMKRLAVLIGTQSNWLLMKINAMQQCTMQVNKLIVHQYMKMAMASTESTEYAFRSGWPLPNPDEFQQTPVRQYLNKVKESGHRTRTLTRTCTWNETERHLLLDLGQKAMHLALHCEQFARLDGSQWKSIIVTVFGQFETNPLNLNLS